MTRQFTALIRGDDAVAARHRGVLASLPAHYRTVADEPADIALATSAASGAGARFAIAGRTAARRLPAGVECLAVASPFLPRLLTDSCFVDARRLALPLIEIVATVAAPADFDDAADEAAAAVAHLWGTAPSLKAGGQTPTSRTVIARGDGAQSATIVVAVSPIGSVGLELAAFSTTARLEVTMDDDAIARPAEVRLVDPAGLRQGQLVHQNSLRLVWLAAHARLTDLL